MTDIDRPIGSPLDSEQMSFVERAGRLLVKVREPDIAPLAAKLGYTEEAQKEGIALHRAASGIDRPFSHALNDGERLVTLGVSQDGGERYRVIDTFENTWMPRMRSAILYFITPEARAEEVVAAFFLNLTQQPLGPKVVDSVDLFLVRREGLLKMENLPGKKALFDALAAMGLTDAVVADMRAKVDAAKLEVAASPAPLVPEAEMRAADRQQQEAFLRLQRWYGLWSGVLRQGLDYHMRIRLGISEARGGRAAGASAGGQTPASPDGGAPLPLDNA